MRTQKSFATISYNSTLFLQSRLNELVELGILDFWCFVEHLPEDDETKKHKHLFCVPSKLLDANSLIDYLKEIDLTSPDSKPLTCIVPHSSKFGDWFLYSSHNVAYLVSKGQSRKYHYSIDDFICSDFDYFNELRHRIDLSKFNGLERLIAAVNNGETFNSLISSGQVPLQLIRQYEYAYNCLVSAKLDEHKDSAL